MEQAYKQIAYLIEQLKEGPRKTTLHMMPRADKENMDIKGPGFWKLDKANTEAVQANLKAYFQRMAIGTTR